MQFAAFLKRSYLIFRAINLHAFLLHTDTNPYFIFKDPHSWGRDDIVRECPKCKSSKHRIKSSGWEDTKACDVDGTFYIFTRRFKCTNPECTVEKTSTATPAKRGKGKGKKSRAMRTKAYSFSMLSEVAVLAMPQDVRLSLPIPPSQPNHSGHHLTYRLCRLMVALGGSGAASIAAVHKAIKELHRQRFIDAQLQYYSRASSEADGGSQKDYERFSVPTVRVCLCMCMCVNLCLCVCVSVPVPVQLGYTLTV